MRILIDFITVFVRKDFLEEAEFDISFSYHRSHKFLKKLLKEMRRGKKNNFEDCQPLRKGDAKVDKQK